MAGDGQLKGRGGGWWVLSGLARGTYRVLWAGCGLKGNESNEIGLKGGCRGVG